MRIVWPILALSCFTISMDVPGTTIIDPVAPGVGLEDEVCVLESGPSPDQVAIAYFKFHKGDLLRSEVSGSDTLDTDTIDRSVKRSDYVVFKARPVLTTRRRSEGKTYVCAYVERY